MTALLIILGAISVAGYIALSVKVGFIVADLTERSGFDVGFYLMAVVGMLSLPFAALAWIYQL